MELCIVIKGEEPWFRAKDVCAVLGIDNMSEALKSIPQGKIDIATSYDAVGRRAKMRFINESGLYRLIFKSRKHEAEAFT